MKTEMFAPKDSNVGDEISAKHMAIGRLSDAISVTVLARMMVGSMSKGDGGGGRFPFSMVAAPIQTRAD